MSDRDSWCTPQYIVDAALEFFGGPPDLDPCSNEHSLMPAKRKIMLPEDGLAANWRWGGCAAKTIWLNPPYSDVGPWLSKLSVWARGGLSEAAVALVRLDPSTEWWRQSCFGRPIVVFSQRTRFVPPPGVKATSPSQNVTAVLFAKAPSKRVVGRFADAFSSIGTMMTPCYGRGLDGPGTTNISAPA